MKRKGKKKKHIPFPVLGLRIRKRGRGTAYPPSTPPKNFFLFRPQWIVSQLTHLFRPMTEDRQSYNDITRLITKHACHAAQIFVLLHSTRGSINRSSGRSDILRAARERQSYLRRSRRSEITKGICHNASCILVHCAWLCLPPCYGEYTVDVSFNLLSFSHKRICQT